MLIPDRWYAVADSAEVSGRKPIGLSRLGLSLVLWRDAAARVSVMADRCPHRGSRLSLGGIVSGRLQCPFHGFEFAGDGACQFIPANGRTAPVPKAFQCQVYPTREEHGWIWMWSGQPRYEYPPVSWFNNLDGFEYATTRKAWDVDETRAIEGLLDVSHLPFVHRNTIGRGSRTLVNGPYTTLEGDVIRVWPTNQPDAGAPALKPSQMTPPAGPAGLEFRFPNVWQLYLSGRTRVVNVVAPVDEGRCVIYLRTYFRLPLPAVMTRTLAWLNNVANRYILSEDYPVIRSQEPRVSGLDIGERFIPADRPIALYLQHRRDLIEATKRQN